MRDGNGYYLSDGICIELETNLELLVAIELSIVPMS